MKKSFLSLKKTHHNTTLFFLLSNCLQKYKISFMTDTLNIIFDDFGIWLPGYEIEFSCLYFTQGHYFLSTVWL